jgi:DNA-binding CsgD family transcriptional regulator
MRLSPRDFDLLQQVILDLHAYREVEEFWQAIPALVLKIFPADYFVMSGYNIDPVARRATVVEYRESSPRINKETVLAMERFVLGHPFTKYFMRTGDPTALKVSDFFTTSQLQEQEFYCEGYRQWGMRRILSIGISSRRSNAAGISVTRNDKDFTERDRFMMNLFQPHFDLAHRNAERAASRRAAGARPLADYELSAREAEVAAWMGNGKTNPEIAIILQASVRTVEKHAAKIIEKVGAPNRTAAALIIFGSAGS